MLVAAPGPCCSPLALLAALPPQTHSVAPPTCPSRPRPLQARKAAAPDRQLVPLCQAGARPLGYAASCMVGQRQLHLVALCMLVQAWLLRRTRAHKLRQRLPWLVLPCLVPTALLFLVRAACPFHPSRRSWSRWRCGCRAARARRSRRRSTAGSAGSRQHGSCTAMLVARCNADAHIVGCSRATSRQHEAGLQRQMEPHTWVVERHCAA